MARRARSYQQSQRRYTDVEELSLNALRRQPVQARGVQRVTDVLDAFELLLRDRRFEDITMEEVATTAKIQIGSLYHFFPDKASVAITVLERALFDEGTVFRLTPDEESLDLRSYLKELEARMAEVWRSHGRLLDLYFAFRTHPLVWEMTLNQRRRTSKHISVKLQQLNSNLTPERAAELATQVSMVMGVLIDNIVYMQQPDRRELRRETRRMLESYITLAS